MKQISCHCVLFNLCCQVLWFCVLLHDQILTFSSLLVCFCFASRWHLGCTIYIYIYISPHSSIHTFRYSRWWYAPIKLCCDSPINTEKKKVELPHAVVTLTVSKCCTWVEPHSVYGLDVFFYIFQRMTTQLQYMFHKCSDRRETFYEF